MTRNHSILKNAASKILANNPVSRIVFFITGKRISFNHLTIRLIALLLRQRIPFHNLTLDVSDEVITPLTKSLLYYGVYEKNEVAFVEKYLEATDDVIELGSSIGVMGGIISKRQTTGRYISVEADPALIGTNDKNIRLNRKTDYVLINKAVDYSNKTIAFSTSENSLNGKVDRSCSNHSAVTVETITLDSLCKDYGFNDFALVCDIEGAEVTILLHDKNALGKCKKMIIELHNTEYDGKTYLIEDMVNLILHNGFKVLDQQGSVYVFQKK